MVYFIFFFFNDTATTEIYTLSLHDALPIYKEVLRTTLGYTRPILQYVLTGEVTGPHPSNPTDPRSEEHTSELQSRQYLVCRLLLEKKKTIHLRIVSFAQPQFRGRTPSALPG